MNQIEPEGKEGLKPEKRFATNATLDTIVKQLEQSLPEFSLFQAVDAFSQSHIYQNQAKDIVTVRGMFMEFYLNHALLLLAQQSPQHLQLNPIFQKPSQADITEPWQVITPTADYYFTMANHTFALEAHWGNDGDNHIVGEYVTDYDAHTLVDGLPVLWETKASRPYNLSDTRSTREVKKAMSDSHVDKIVAPIKSFFQTDTIGYAIVVPKGTAHSASTSQARFQEQNGKLVELPYTFEEITTMIQKKGLVSQP